MTKLRQHVMHCRCGKAKVLAHGMCAVCYTLKRQDEEHFGGFARRCSGGTAIDAGCAMPPGATNALSSFITAYPGSQLSLS